MMQHLPMNNEVCNSTIRIKEVCMNWRKREVSCVFTACLRASVPASCTAQTHRACKLVMTCVLHQSPPCARSGNLWSGLQSKKLVPRTVQPPSSSCQYPSRLYNCKQLIKADGRWTMLLLGGTRNAPAIVMLLWAQVT